MKNLFLTAAMLVFLGSAIAQETPEKTKKQSARTSDTIKKSKKGSDYNSSTYKTDTVKKHRTDKKATKVKSTDAATNRDSLEIIKP